MDVEKLFQQMFPVLRDVKERSLSEALPCGNVTPEQGTLGRTPRTLGCSPPHEVSVALHEASAPSLRSRCEDVLGCRRRRVNDCTDERAGSCVPR